MKERRFGWQAIRKGVATLAAFVTVYVMTTSLGFAQAEDATKLLKDATTWFAEVMQFVLVVITILSFVVAAWAAIQVVSAMMNRKGEVGGVFMVLIVAVFLTIFVGQMAFQGSAKIDELTEGG